MLVGPRGVELKSPRTAPRSNEGWPTNKKGNRSSPFLHKCRRPADAQLRRRARELAARPNRARPTRARVSGSGISLTVASELCEIVSVYEWPATMEAVGLSKAPMKLYTLLSDACEANRPVFSSAGDHENSCVLVVRSKTVAVHAIVPDANVSLLAGVALSTKARTNASAVRLNWPVKFCVASKVVVTRALFWIAAVLPPWLLALAADALARVRPLAPPVSAEPLMNMSPSA